MLAFDIGNGSVKYARFAQGRRLDGGRLALDADFAGLGAGPAAAVSVNPPVLERLRAARPGLGVVGENLAPGIEVVAYDPPEDCGLDRVLGVVGVLHKRPDAHAVLVLDSGTCLTATLGVRGEGVLGGAIAPGVDLMARALAEGTASLPRVTPGEPARWVGRSTGSSIRTGVWLAFVGGAREIVRRFREETGLALEVVAVGSGGGALAKALPEVDAVVPFATLWGVYLAAGGPGL